MATRQQQQVSITLTAVLLISSCVHSLNALAVSKAGAGTSNLDLDGWTLTWNDEFDGSELSNSHWTLRNNESHCCGPNGAEELQLYMAYEDVVSDGKWGAMGRSVYSISTFLYW